MFDDVIEKLIADTACMMVEEYRVYCKTRSLKEIERERREEEERKKRSLEEERKLKECMFEIIDSTPIAGTLKANRSQIGKVVKWSSSRFNEYTKSWVVRYIISEALSPHDVKIWDRHECGAYSSGYSKSYGTFRVVIRDGISYLIINEQDGPIVYEIIA